jgi:hypothetical protein
MDNQGRKIIVCDNGTGVIKHYYSFITFLRSIKFDSVYLLSL